MGNNMHNTVIHTDFVYKIFVVGTYVTIFLFIYHYTFDYFAQDKQFLNKKI